MVVEHKTKQNAWPQKVLDTERINGGVVCWPAEDGDVNRQRRDDSVQDSLVPVAHEVEDVAAASNEENLHE